MATVQQSIDIRVPVHAVYNQLTQFEDYPRFMEEVESVKQIDDTHLHWKTIMSNHAVEWDAEITEQEPDCCIAWHNTSGPTNSARVEVRPLGEDSARVTFTVESQPQQVPGSSSGNSEQDLAQRLKMDLARLKDVVERRGSETGAWRGEVHDSPRNSPVPTSSYAAGSEGWAGDEDPAAPVTSAAENAKPRSEPAQPAQSEQSRQSPQPGSTAAAVARADDTRTGIAGGAVSGVSEAMDSDTATATARPRSVEGTAGSTENTGETGAPGGTAGTAGTEAGARP